MSLPTRRLLAALTSLALILVGTSGAAAALSGPDVASYQHPSGYSIGWSTAAASGKATFAFVKATEGTGYTNPWFATDFAGMASNGIMRGAYHFANPAQSATAQAQYFVSVVGKLGRVGDLPPVLDLETTGGLSPAQLVAWTQTWLQTVRSLTGRTPMIYTGPYFWQSAMGNSRAFTGYPLWIASYGVSSPQVPGGWPTWTFWQYTSTATLPGVSGAVDMNVFNGSLAQLQALAGGAPAPVQPIGSLDTATWTGSTLATTGWAVDPTTAASIPVTLTLDGRSAQTLTASLPRGDVAAAYPAAGANHGFSATFVTTPGNHSVCAVAKGTTGGTTSFGCRTVSVPVTPPMGSFDSAAWSGTSLAVRGWAIDPTTTGAASVSVSVDGTTVQSVPAAGARSDIAAAYPAFGANHGYAVSAPATPGSHQVCVTASGNGGATSRSLGCRTVTVPVTPPFGSLDSATWTGSSLAVRGWAVDPATAQPIPVTVSIDGTTVGAPVSAGAPRPDVGAAMPAFGSAHGYTALVPASAGTHQVCATAVNAAASLSGRIGCQTVAVPATPPFGSLDQAAWTGTSLLVRGWTVDPATSAPIDVTVTIDGTAVKRLPAADPRGDIAAHYPATGANHGYTTVLPVGGGTHQVCVTAANAAGTLSRQVGCRSVAVPVLPPVGSFDSASWSGTAVSLRGWALSLATSAPITVALTLDGRPAGTVVATGARADIGQAYPAQGANHGWTATVGAAPGTHTVCATAQGVGTRPLGCRTLVVPRSQPVGALDSLRWTGTAVSAYGWAVDLDTTSPISVALTLDGRPAGTVVAASARADIGHAFPAYGPDHGYTATIPASPGSHQVCATALNYGAGTTNTALGCRTIVVPRSQPVGSLDSVSWNGSSLWVHGWAIDPDVTAPITVSVSVDGKAPVPVTANVSRPDIARAFPAYGATHGFDWYTPAARGSHSVCVTALNVGAGTTNTAFACRTVVVP